MQVYNTKEAKTHTHKMINVYKHKRISGVKITTESNFSYVLLAIYMPCDNFSNTVNQEYVDVVNTIEFVINSEDCNGIIVCGDFNTSFSRSNAQSACLTDFINRNRLISSWDNPHANIDFTYCNHSLNHFSVIDHFIVSSNIYDSITASIVLWDPTNISLHNAISVYVKFWVSTYYFC